MTSDEILSTLKTILSEQLAIEPETITAESSFRDLGADSLDEVEIVMAIEEEFGFDIEDEESEKATTVGDAVKMIEEKLG